MSKEVKIEIPDKLRWVFHGEARYRGAYGGRGSGKSYTFALMSAVWGYIFGNNGKEGKILCGREFMNSLADSSFNEVKEAIERTPWLNNYYKIGSKYIRSKDENISYIFTGLRRSVNSVKSKSKILLAWIDEAEGVSEEGWEKLTPTVRAEKSEIWITWNPERKDSPTHKRFRENPPKNSKIVEMNWKDNPWFPEVLEKEKQFSLENYPERYDHIWEGAFRTFTESGYYLQELINAKKEERICTVNYIPNEPVFTSWDLGMSDLTSIWFVQKIGTEIHIIDYYEDSGIPLDRYVKKLKDKNYIYGKHYFPHDVKVSELGTGLSRLEVLENLGLTDIEVLSKFSLEDGIEQVRSFLQTCWFDKEKCQRGLDALRSYRREYNNNLKIYKNKPLHDWASHAADSFRYMAVGCKRDMGLNKTNWEIPIKRNLSVMR